MKMRLPLFTFVVLLACQFQVSAQQEFGCKHAGPDSGSLKKIKQLSKNVSKSTDLKVIPVVFHVLHQYGSENISDEQILDAMHHLNLDFKKLDPDTADVISPFDTIIGKVNFEFRLATIDPDGNPTSGIDRIVTSLTNDANDQSKINSWDPQKYVNIWVVKSIEFSGISGYTTNPVSGVDPCMDGIVMLNDYIGTIGTGSPFRHFFLTHEMGHFFGLFHVSDHNLLSTTFCDYTDGIYDTPRQAMVVICNLTSNTCNDSLYAESFNYWGYDVPDMIQNFMTTSYCMRMFTNGQAAVMRNVVESPLYGRDQLWTEANLIATGTGPGTAPVSTALPSSDFGVQTGLSPNFLNSMTCVGDSVKLIHASGQGNAVSYQWSFPGGSPSVSSLPNPKVAFMAPGYYDITLTVTNANGSTTTTKNAAVYASASWPEFVGPTTQDFNISGDFWQIENPGQQTGYFQRIATNGVQNTGCFLLNNHFDPDTTSACYQSLPEQNNKSKDNLISPSFDLSNSSNVMVSFDYAYGTSAPDTLITETLRVYSSRDCGKTWQLRTTVSVNELATATVPQSANFVPAANQWNHISFNYPVILSDTRTRFKFEFVASNYSNNLYIDNFVIDGILGISGNELAGISVHPNPSKPGGVLTISGLGASESDVMIYDLQGKVVYEKTLNSAKETITLESHLKAGCYLVEVSQNGSKFLTRWIVE